MDDLDMALLIDAVAKRTDPLGRFVDSLSEELRKHARETIRMRDEFTRHCQSVLASSDPLEARLHAEWLARHAHEVAYRWGSLVRSATRWAMFDVEGVAIRTPRPPIREGGKLQ